MGIQDLIIAPLYFLIILMIGNFIKNKMDDPVIRTYFMKGLVLKLIGAIGISIIYFYYYGTGDTVYYFERAKLIDSVLIDKFYVGLKLLFANPAVYDSDTFGYFARIRGFDPSSLIIVRIAAITNIICFNSYLANAFIFSALSYIGIWKLFKMINNLFPKNTKIIAWSFLFIPSVFFWGSGILKDNVTLGFLGIFISSFYFLFIKRKKIFPNSILFIIATFMIGIIKSYILLAAFPAIFAWLFFTYRNRIQSKSARIILTPVLLALIAPLVFGALQLMSSSFNKFSLDNAQEKAEDMQRWHTYRVEVLKEGEGSSYNLGQIVFTPLGIAAKTPAAITAAIFRPYIWEAGNPVVFLSALESLFFLFVTIRLIFLFLRAPGRGFQFLGDNSILYFMIIFSLIFAFSVGFTSYNFGALSRYRIPLLPFYLCAILLTTDHLKNYKKAR